MTTKYQKKQTTIVGIDYSLNSPAICIAGDNFDFDKCVSKNYLSISQKMPTINEIIVNNDFMDIGGEDVEVLKLGDYDRSHHESKDNGGSNTLDNLSAEKSGPNRSRGSQNINK